MKNRLEKEGLDSLLEELKSLDPVHYNNVDKKNPRRILHALEICHQTGLPYSSFMTNRKKERPFNIVKIALRREREELYERINSRVLKMMDEGFLEEAKSVLSKINDVFMKSLSEKGVQIIEKDVKIDKSDDFWVLTNNVLIQEKIGKKSITQIPETGEMNHE